MEIKTDKICEIFQQNQLFVSASIEKDSLELDKVKIDSREIAKGDVFIAIEGLEQDGHNYIDKAIMRGARLIIHTKPMSIGIDSILVKDSRKAGALLASELNDNPSQKLKLIGVTGTNGKTTSSMMIFDILNRSGIKCGIIGTLGYSSGKEFTSLNRTTPDIDELNQILNKMVQDNCQVVVMEVSSHSLVLDRVFGQKFAAIGFTNLTQDHLDFHHTIDNYFLAKKVLFDIAQTSQSLAVVNIDDIYGQKYFSEYNSRKISYGFTSKADIYASHIENTTEATKFILNRGNSREELVSNYIGDFNIYNLMLALTLCKEVCPEHNFTNIDLTDLKKTTGRLERIESQTAAKVFIDYAHTPDAIEQVLKTTRKLTTARLIAVLGSGGDRDCSKRSLMALQATSNADLVILTDDNPRKEDHNLIIADMVKGLHTDNYFIIRDRRVAIESSLSLAKENDIVVILGKGHENYQEINGIKYHFSDAEVITEYSHKEKKNELELPYDVLNLLDLKQKFENYYDRNEFALFPEDIIGAISTDTRNLKENSLFIALKGEKFDANDFIPELHNNHTKIFSVGNRDFSNHRHLKVHNPLHYYGFIAKRYLQLFDIKKIAITGSTGKTTSKEILTNILEESHSVLKTFGNENNYIGLPRTIFRIKKEDDYAVFEIGTNNFGEIDYLSNIVNPHYAIITSVDSAHLEKLQSIEGVYKEKTALFKRKLEKFLFPGDNPLFSEYKSEEYRNVGYSIGKGNDNSFIYRILEIKDGSLVLQINNSQFDIATSIPYYDINYAFAISLAKLLGISINDIIFGLKKTLNVSNRMNIINKGKLTIIADCYNANPKSTMNALNFWYEFKANEKHIAILGDMLELGTEEVSLHEEIRRVLSSFKDVKIISIGRLAKLYAGHVHFDNVQEFIESAIISELKVGVILLKASHGIKLEKILEVL